MKKSFRAGALGTGLAGLVIAGAGAAYASHTVVDVNGNHTVGDVAYTATNLTPTIAFNTDYGVKMICDDASIDGDIKRGASVGIGNTIATIDNLSFTNCTMAGWIPVSVSMTGGDIKVRNHPTNAGDPVDVTITDIHASIASTNGSIPCTFEADGSLDGVISTGTDAELELVPAVFSGATPVSGFDLDISNVVGCGGEVLDGDRAGSWHSDKTTSDPSAFEVDTEGPVTHVVP